MLHLADAFGYSDLSISENGQIAIDGPWILTDDEVSLNQYQLVQAIRHAAQETYYTFYRHIESEKTISIQQKAIGICLPSQCSMVVATLAVAGLSMIACPIHPNLSIYELKKFIKDLNIEMIIAAGDNPAAREAAEAMHIPLASFVWHKLAEVSDTQKHSSLKIQASIPTGKLIQDGNGSPDAFDSDKLVDNWESSSTRSTSTRKSTSSVAGLEWMPVISSTGRLEPVRSQDTAPISPKEFEVCIKFTTAGTTSRRKIVPLTHRNIVMSLANIQKTYGWKGHGSSQRTSLQDIPEHELDPDADPLQRIASVPSPSNVDIGLCMLPLHQSQGLIACLAAIAVRSCVILPPKDLDASNFWDIVAKKNITWTSVFPGAVYELVSAQKQKRRQEGAASPERAPEASPMPPPSGAGQLSSRLLSPAPNPSVGPHSLKFIRVTGTTLPKRLLREAEEMFGTTIIEAYGLTEASHQVSSNGYPLLKDRRPGTVGKPTGCEVAIIDSNCAMPHCLELGQAGEIWIRGYNVVDSFDKIVDEQAGLPSQEGGHLACDFLSHNEIEWFEAKKPSFYSTAFELASKAYSVTVSRRISLAHSISISDEASADDKAEERPPSGLPRPEDPVQIPLAYPKPADVSPVMASPDLPETSRANAAPVAEVKPPPSRHSIFLRQSSALRSYTESDFPQRDDPLLSPLPLTQRWLKTGDIGVMEEGGYFRVIARDTDCINTRGIKISAIEIEEVFKQFPEISQAAAFGVYHPIHGEVPAVALILDPKVQFSSALEQDFRRRAGKILSEFKVGQKRVHRDAVCAQRRKLVGGPARTQALPSASLAIC